MLSVLAVAGQSLGFKVLVYEISVFHTPILLKKFGYSLMIYLKET